MLTALDIGKDIMRGLNLGSGDYPTKAFTLDVLFAPLKAVARRRSAPTFTKAVASGQRADRGTCLAVGLLMAMVHRVSPYAGNLAWDQASSNSLPTASRCDY